uniref:Uncharacterized protein n=1 Tax=Anopheles culicifacies TaxID=139723 RepID=A0A182M5R2_9DIPT
MYESSCSYQTALDLKRGASPLVTHQVKSEDCLGLTQCTDWGTYRFHQSTFEQLKQSVEKAKAALQDRTSFLGSSSAFSDIYSSPRLTESLENVISHTTGNNNSNNGTTSSNPVSNGTASAESNPANTNATSNASNAGSVLNVSGSNAGSGTGNGGNTSSNNGAGGSGGGGTSSGGGGGGSSISVINATSLVSPSNLLGNGLTSQRHRNDLLGTGNLNLVSSTQSPTTTSTPSSILSQNLESPVDVKSRQATCPSKEFDCAEFSVALGGGPLE